MEQRKTRRLLAIVTSEMIGEYHLECSLSYMTSCRLDYSPIGQTAECYLLPPTPLTWRTHFSGSYYIANEVSTRWLAEKQRLYQRKLDDRACLWTESCFIDNFLDSSPQLYACLRIATSHLPNLKANKSSASSPFCFNKISIKDVSDPSFRLRWCQVSPFEKCCSSLNWDWF